MSKDNVEQDNALPSTAATPDRRRATVPEIVKHQQSFEKRYSNIIQKQILETSINMDALHRQMNAFLSFSKSPPKSFDIATTRSADEEFPKTEKAENPIPDGSQEKSSMQPQPQKPSPLRTESNKTRSIEKHLEKAATVDIAERSAIAKK